MSEPMEELSQPLRELRSKFEAQVEPHRRALWNYCRRLTGSVWDAEDLVQEVLQRTLAGLADYWQPVHPRAYMFRVATNLWIDRRRREVRAELVELDDALVGAGGSPSLNAEVHEAIAELVDRLTPLQRVVFLLCESFDFRTSEVAQLLATTDGAVKAALHRARVSLAAAHSNPRKGSAAMQNRELRDVVVRKYIEAFDARDPDALVALLHEDTVTIIVGSAVEMGRDISRRNSIAEWAAEPVEQWARSGVLDGRDVLFIHAHHPEHGGEVLYSIIELQTAGGFVREQKNYFFSPELLEHAAAELNIPVLTHGYQYVG